MNHAEAAERELAELESQLKAITEGVPDDAATEEVKAEEPVAPVAEPEPEAEPVKDAEYWKAEFQKAEAVKNKRDKDLERGLHATLQEKSGLEKELEVAREKAAEVDALKAEIERLRSKQTSESISLDADFEESYPDIAAQIKGIASKMQLDADKRVEDLRREIAAQKERIEAERSAAAVQEHFLNVQAVHPDAAEYFDQTKLGGAIHAWASTKSDVVESILSNPANYKPKDVAWVISEFKKEVGLAQKPKAKPVTGDISIKTGHATQISDTTGADDFSEVEMKSYDKMLEKAKRISDPVKRSEALNELERKLTNTLFKSLD